MSYPFTTRKLKPMIMRTLSLVILTTIVLSGCQFSKSVKKDFVTGLTTTGNVLSCDDIYLTVKDQKITRNTFVYGEKLYVNFNDIKGFIKENEYVFPGMELTITDLKGDTVFKADDLYADFPNGVNYTPLLLSADIIVADPMHSGSDYTLFISIWDKKGSGTFEAKLPFKIKPNEAIKVEANSVSYNEIYLFSENGNEVITDNIIHYDDNVYVLFEGLTGFKVADGLVFPGLSLKVSDADNNSILDYENLFTEYSEKGIDPESLAQRVSCHFSLTGSGAKNPLHCIVSVHDMKSEAKVIASTELTIQ